MLGAADTAESVLLAFVKSTYSILVQTNHHCHRHHHSTGFIFTMYVFIITTSTMIFTISSVLFIVNTSHLTKNP